jgi:hypothetical protein
MDDYFAGAVGGDAANGADEREERAEANAALAREQHKALTPVRC